MFILDTDIATLAFHNHHRVMQHMMQAETTPVVLSVVTRLEMLYGRIEAVRKAATGAELLRATDRLMQTEAFLGRFAIVSIHPGVAEQFDALRKLKKLQTMNAGDRLQAAIALAGGATLVTRNTKDYANVPNLPLANWAA
ncbi:MAG: type II toxin-antitoxin system VapC family toxin [Gemmataceae bacterium]|nr:type II toxin-antitoxin system VapC family toxin [Gemmata sp.]MDW8198278.1 type II toxin-antitoxin system VapC family toxin [Gemmataceae bacterium]